MDKYSWTTSEIISATSGKLLCGDINHRFSGISIDSRKVVQDDFFVAIKGAVHNGHNFIRDVIEKGISGVLLEENEVKLVEGYKDKICVAVSDTTIAIGNLARFQRKRGNPVVVAITGSNGKTTCKEMTTSVSSKRFNTLFTTGNLNNEIGLPLTLFRLSKDHDVAVLELGMNNFGEIRRLSNICLPNIGVITNIGPAHLEKLGSIDGVMNAKGELLENIQSDGTAVLNADDPRSLKLSAKASTKVLLYGESDFAQVRAKDIEEKEDITIFTLVLPQSEIKIKLNMPARFMVLNALSAAAVGYLLGLTGEEIKKGLEEFKPVTGRMNIFKNSKNINIIDDSYNANPGSMEAAILTLSKLKGSNRGILVIGDMLELGEAALELHCKIGEIASKLGINRLYVTGIFSSNVAESAIKSGMKYSDVFVGVHKDIIEDISKWLNEGDWVLVKGSHAMQMEKIVFALKEL
ncbi:MAG: UDP-N-acetylmuramoyl-tripeptide--D-alanyl-D-alanine ligase [Desulfobacterales bacterium]|nr:UDP-N-acetylmuramoyl-tripeptide--D-alanyl-D-alanine ligase [Desulfobacterales bacterium]MBF0396047.1 UDP-N-acetylmuramoyl-tripeptide--D-alanyl-D-alanine ligase [Desulfobacterales bacterium]